MLGALAQAAARRVHGGAAALAKAQRELECAVATEVDAGRLHQVALRGLREALRQAPVGSSWVSPSLAWPAKPLETSRKGREASSALCTGMA